MAYESFLSWYQRNTPVHSEPARTAAVSEPKKAPKRSISMTDPRFWNYFNLGRTSMANVDVTQMTGLGVPPFFCAVRYISEGIAMLDRVVKSDSGDGVADAKDHPMHRFFNYRPHPNYSWFDLICAWVTNACIGNGYIRMHMDYSTMRPMFFEHIPSIYCRPEYDYNGNLWYVISGNVNGRVVIERLPPTEILHLKGLSLDGVMGLDLTQIHQSTLATGIARQQYTESVLGKGARPSIAIKSNEELEPEEVALIEENVMNRIGGTENAGRPLVLDSGQEVQYLQWSPLEAALDALARLNVEDVARITKVPRDFLGLETNGTLGAVVQRSQDMLTHCLGPWVEKIQEEISYKAFFHQEALRRTAYFEFDTSMFLSLDPVAESEMLVKEVAGTVRTPNEVRVKKGLPPLAGGDELMVDINLLPISKAVEVALAKYLSSKGEQARADAATAGNGDNQNDNTNEPDAQPTN